MSIFVSPLVRTATRKKSASSLDPSSQVLDDINSACGREADGEGDLDVSRHRDHDDHTRTLEEDTSDDEHEEDGPSNRDGDAHSVSRIDERSRTHRSLRYQHIDVLNTLLHKSILDSDYHRALRAFSLLLRTKGIDIRSTYDLALEILNHTDPSGAKSIELLSRLIIAYPPLKSRRGKRDFDRADVFVRKLVQLRIYHRMFKTAMQELDGWLLVPPYKDDRQLWRYYALVCHALEKQAEEEGQSGVVRIMKEKRKKATVRMNGQQDGSDSDGAE